MTNFSSQAVQMRMQAVLQDYRTQMRMYTDEFGLPFASCHEDIATLNDELENRLQRIRARMLAEQDPRNFSGILAAATIALVYSFCVIIHLLIYLC